jgi:demethylmenaquinone methyltransferase / 2-methoxy-6-polyprenyl-1,4-benzoquinol methylase
MQDRESGRQMEPRTTRLSDLDLEAHLSDPARKQQFVTPMFDVIAPQYDRFTRVFSFGMDARWKRQAIEAAVSQARRMGHVSRVLDLASGTGDLAIGIARQLADAQVTGIDASPNMVQAALRRMRLLADSELDARVAFRTGDMTALDVPERSVELITAGYAVRNVPDYSRALREMARVTRPGATLVTLDFYRPESAPWRKVLLAWLSMAGNIVGWLWHREPVIYGYIARSIDHFVSWQEFSRMLEGNGFRVHQVMRHLGGGIAIHVATRE